MIYLLFFLSSFLIQIMFLNMLIAIMGDAFDQATEKREINATSTKLKIMGDYVDLILKDEDEEEGEGDEEGGADRPSAAEPRLSDLFNRNSEPSNDQKEREEEAKLLYIVEPVVDAANE